MSLEHTETFGPERRKGGYTSINNMYKVTQSVFLCSCIVPTSIPPAVSLHWWLKSFLYLQRVKLCFHVVISLFGLSAGTEPRIS